MRINVVLGPSEYESLSGPHACLECIYVGVRTPESLAAAWRGPLLGPSIDSEALG